MKPCFLCKKWKEPPSGICRLLTGPAKQTWRLIIDIVLDGPQTGLVPLFTLPHRHSERWGGPKKSQPWSDFEGLSNVWQYGSPCTISTHMFYSSAAANSYFILTMVCKWLSVRECSGRDSTRDKYVFGVWQLWLLFVCICVGVCLNDLAMMSYVRLQL